MFPLVTTRCLHVRHEVRDPSGGSGNCGRECCPVILPKWRLPRHLGIYDLGPTALLPLRRKAVWGFKIRRLRPGLNTRTWVLKASTLPLDHRSRFKKVYWGRKYIALLDEDKWSKSGPSYFITWQRLNDPSIASTGIPTTNRPVRSLVGTPFTLSWLPSL